MENQHLYVIMCVELNTLFSQESKIADVQRTLGTVRSTNVLRAYKQCYGKNVFKPYLVFYMEHHPDVQHDTFKEYMAKLHVMHQYYCNHPQQVQNTVDSMVSSLLTPELVSVYTNCRHVDFIQTCANIMTEHNTIKFKLVLMLAFYVHALLTSANVSSVIVPTDKPVSLPAPSGNAYIAFTNTQHVVHIDVHKGFRDMEIVLPLTVSWAVRVYHTYVLCGNAHKSVLLSFSPDDLRLESMVEVQLQVYPLPNAYCGDGVHILWCGHNGRMCGLEFDVSSQTARLCSEREVEIYSMMYPYVHASGNQVFLNRTLLCTLANPTSITCVYGDARSLDCFTKHHDWWRVDVLRNESQVLGLGTYVVCAVVPV